VVGEGEAKRALVSQKRLHLYPAAAKARTCAGTQPVVLASKPARSPSDSTRLFLVLDP
jgi:hypothetical protein